LYVHAPIPRSVCKCDLKFIIKPRRGDMLVADQFINLIKLCRSDM